MSTDARTVWYLSKYLTPPKEVGVGSRGYYLMRELARRGYRCVIVTSDANHLADAPEFNSPHLLQHKDGMQLYWIRTLKYRSVRSLRRIISWFHFDLGLLRLSRHIPSRPDVVVASSLSLTTAIPAIILSRLYRARFIFEVRDIWPLTLTEEGGYSRWNPLIVILGLIEKMAYLHADAIIGTMPNLGEHVREVSKSTRPVHCVPMGYDTVEDIGTGWPEQLRRSSVPADRFIVGYAGSVGATNALGTLLETATALESDPRFHFVIVGGGDLLDDFRRRYGSLSNLSFVGRVPRSSVAAVLNQFDVLYLSTFPSKVWKYGQSLNKMIDYMLSAKPVVASYSGYPSMLNEAGAGTFVPAGDAAALTSEIYRLFELSDDEREAMGKQGREWLLANRSYATLATLFESILFEGDGRGPAR